jgi:hypothetical protein
MYENGRRSWTEHPSLQEEIGRRLFFLSAPLSPAISRYEYSIKVSTFIP